MRQILTGLVLALSFFVAQAKEVIPPAPENHFNDYASVVNGPAAAQLNNELVEFERATGNQFVVAIFQKMQSDSSIEDYTLRVARAWKIGTKEKNNGVALFVFVQDHKLYIQTGYGLEGTLPDVLCHRIIENEIVPHLKQGDYAGGLIAGIHAIIAATEGEYRGSGKTVREKNSAFGTKDLPRSIFAMVFFSFIVFAFIRRLRQSSPYLITSRRRSGIYMDTGSSWGGFSGGGGGGGGSFSGGGGSFGGGGAGGSW